jgi:cytochrome P450
VVQTLEWMYRPVPFIEGCRRRYGDVFSLRLGPRRNTVVVADPAAARQVMRGDPSLFRAGDANGILKPVVGPASLLVLDGDEHMRHRRILLPELVKTPKGTAEFTQRVQPVLDGFLKIYGTTEYAAAVTDGVEGYKMAAGRSR